MSEKTLTPIEANFAHRNRITDWRDFKPGLYRYVYPKNGNAYEDIAVFGITPDGRYEYTTLDIPIRWSGKPSTGSLADAGVMRTGKHDSLPDYLGVNFVVPLHHFKS